MRQNICALAVLSAQREPWRLLKSDAACSDRDNDGACGARRTMG